MPDAAIRCQPPVPATEWMKPMPPAMRFILHGDAQARRLASPVWGVAFAEQSCRAMTQGARATLWLGPDEYLLLPHALVNVSHRQFALQLGGPNAATILSGACPLDLNVDEFPVGMCTRTVLAKADIVLWRTRDESFHVEVWRSFAGYVTGLLSEIASEFYGR